MTRPFRLHPLTACFAPRLIAALLVLALPIVPALGQIIRIPPETAQSVTLSGAQQEQVTRFLDSLRPRVFGEDKADASRAMSELLDPLRDERVSVAFRQAMSAGLTPDIERALADTRPLLDDGTINARPYLALRLAGEIATDRTLQLIVDELDSEDDGRRFFAIHCTEVVFFSVRTSAPAVTDQTLFHDRGGGRIEGLAPTLARMIVTEPSPRHAAAIVRSLTEATQIRREQIPGLSAYAVRSIAERTSERIKANRGSNPSEDERLVWLTAGQSVQRVIAQTASGVDSVTALQSIRLAGHLVASVFREVESGRVVPVDQRGADDAAVIEKQTLGLAQNLMIFGEQRHAEATGRRRTQALEDSTGVLLDAFLGRGGNFRQSSLAIVSASGLLASAPYSFPGDEFIRD